jgi:hypothetical protein
MAFSIASCSFAKACVACMQGYSIVDIAGYPIDKHMETSNNSSTPATFLGRGRSASDSA